jgi:hypothetical protein
MRKLLRFFCAMLMIGLLVTTYALTASATEYSGPKQLTPQLSSDGKTMYNGIPAVVYVADPNPPENQAYIPPPFNLSTPPNKASTISITYTAAGSTDPWGKTCVAFPSAAQTAFTAAAAIWEGLLTSSVPIRITACWSSIGSSNILGYSGGGPLRRDFTGALRANTWYSGSLANAIAGSDLDPSAPDMYITYNNQFTWYYPTSGTVPTDQYDLMSVVLHEIAHGLNFAGSMESTDGTTGTADWGYSTGYPNIYDTFMKDGSGVYLTNTVTYPHASTALGNVVRSSNIWFHGTNAMAANSGTRVKMYAPSTWAGGSSYSHLDYTTFNGTANRLMVFAISSGVATHAPGPVTLGLFKDLGWTVVVNNPVPVISSLSPTSATWNDAAFTTLIVNGSSFVNGAIVRWNDSNRTTTFVSATQVTAAITATDLQTAGVFPVTVFNPTPGGGTSNTINFTVNNPVPVISSLSPSSIVAGSGAFTLDVNGSGFCNDSVVSWNGINHAYLSSSTVSKLQVTMPAADIASATTYSITVFNTTPGGGTSTPMTFIVTAPPAPGGGGGGCFIATAAFGTPFEKHVNILREFRDRCLLTTSPGQAFVKFYYEVSPPIAGKIAQNEGLRFITRCSLMPLVGMAYLMVTYGATTILLSLLSFILMIGVVTWTIRRKMFVVSQ